MARMYRAPRHSLTRQMKFVAALDGAWDMERINEELDGDVSDKDDHPYMQYVQGQTRYDIEGTEGLMEYLDLAKKPEIWLIKRLTIEDQIRIAACQSELEANTLAFCLGVKEVQNAEEAEDLSEALTSSKRSEVRIRRLAYAHSKDCLMEVGAAVIRGSEDLREPEKKASGSQAGD